MILSNNPPLSISRKFHPGRGFSSIKIFWILFLSFYTVPIFGNFFVSEFIFLALFLRGILNGDLKASGKYLKPSVRFMLIAAAGEIIADIWHGSSIVLALKGFSLIFFTLVNLCALVLITQLNSTKVRIGILGFAASGLAAFIFQPGTYARSDIWKFGIGYPLTLFVFCLLSLPVFKYRKSWSVTIIIIFSLISLYLGARSLALLTFLAIFFNEKTHESKKLQKPRNLAIPILLLLSILIFANIYGNLAKNGNLGVKAQEKYSTQTSSGENIVLVSRSEILIAGRAIVESPLMVYGSYSAMSSELRNKVFNFLADYNVSYDSGPLLRNYGDRIPVHSMLLQWWLWFGILGLLFPLYLLLLLYKSLTGIKGPIVFSYLALSGVWNVLFSPYGEGYRILVPLSIIAVLSQLKEISGFGVGDVGKN